MEGWRGGGKIQEGVSLAGRYWCVGLAKVGQNEALCKIYRPIEGLFYRLLLLLQLREKRQVSFEGSIFQGVNRS